VAFIPFYDDNPLHHIKRAWVTWSLIGANCLIYFFTADISDAVQASAMKFGLIPAVFNDVAELPRDYQSIPDSLKLVTHAFLHGDFWHLLGNMIFLWVFADNVEDSLGHFRFFAFYILSAIGAGYIYVLASPASEAPVIGASGAIAGVVAAYLLLHTIAKVWDLDFSRIPLHVPAFGVLGFWILYQIYEVIVAEPGDIAWWTHIGGFITGTILVLLLRPRDALLFGRNPPLSPTAAVDEAATGPIGSAAPSNVKGPGE
jgi:membrane associated rhomboid family serine protease